MITAEDLGGKREKYGFKVTLTFEALDVLLRKHFDMPQGEIKNIYFEQERDILIIKYITDENIKIGQACEYPERAEICSE